MEHAMRRVSVFLPTDLIERLRAVAARRREPVAHVVREILEKGVRDYRSLPQGGFLP